MCRAAEGEILQVRLLPAHAEADRNDDDKIKEQNCAIDREPAVHVDLR